MKKNLNFLPYHSGYFSGGAVSWAAQGKCSICSRDKPRGAQWMVRHGRRGYRAYCDDCKNKSTRR